MIDNASSPAAASVRNSTWNSARRRYLALWLPFLPTDRLRRTTQAAGAGRDEVPLVVIEKRHGALALAACDPRALRLGLQPGLSLTDARARHPDIDVVEADPEADSQAIADLAAFCDRITPLVALDPPHGLMLDITGCAHLFGGEDRLDQSLRRRFQGWGLHARAAIAGAPDAARALARFGAGGICPPGEDEKAAQSLPLAALEAPAETAIALSRAGFRTLGDLAIRPSAILSARFGEDLGVRLRRILGREDRRITPLRPLPDCMVERRFAEPLSHDEGISHALSRLADEATKALERRGEGGRRFEASFFRSDGATRRIAVETARPMRDSAALMRLLREKLDALNDPLDPGFGFDAIRLAVPLCEPLHPAQPSLDGKVVEDQALADLVDRLMARFGRDRVVRFLAQDTHIPERAAKSAPAASPEIAAEWPRPRPGEPPCRPLQMFDPPQPIEAMAEIPDGPPLRFRWRRVAHEIARAEGPERIAPEWWRDGHDEPIRDYYRVEDARGHRFWVFRRGLYGEQAGEPRWFLHGVFA